MIKIIPAILENSIEDIKKRVEQVKPYVDLVHLDIMDGQFVPNTTFNDPALLATTKLGIKYSPHLMIKHPEFFIKKWNLEEVDTIFIHKEVVTNLNEAIRLIRDTGKKVGVAINPHTSSYDIKEYLDLIDELLVMGVEPGFSSQAFNSDVLAKIVYLKKDKPDLLISVDGGINLESKNKIIRSGANILCVNSFIFKSSDIKSAIESLKN